MNELFPIEESLSPKLAWLRAHGLITMYDDEAGGEWMVTQDGVLEIDRFCLGSGATEEEAIADACAKLGIVHYLLK